MIEVFILSLMAFKLLLFPCYHSSDFEVHRNWLAVTSNRPLTEWYFDKSSEWTLDYPPFFAYFEYLLSHIAVLVDPKMLRLRTPNYASWATVVFQRSSVLFTELLLISSALKLATAIGKCLRWSSGRILLAKNTFMILIVGNVGLLIVDNIHFQYNGFLFGMLFYSIYYLLENRVLHSALLFVLLLHFKHIFLYMAPAYFVYLLRNFCFYKSDKDDYGIPKIKNFIWHNFGGLAFTVVSVFGASFGPFVVFDSWKRQVPQILSRLFPFKRGLTHAYWAPNFWALYNLLDYALVNFAKRYLPGFEYLKNVVPGYATGLVQEFKHIMLPSIDPKVTLLMTVLCLIPFLVFSLSYRFSVNGFIRLLTISAFTAYMFGWHVHEKAILMVILPYTILAVQNRADARLWLFLSIIGHFSLGPLLFTPFEIALRVVLGLTYAVASWKLLSQLFPDITEKPSWILRWTEIIYLLGLIPLDAFLIFYPASSFGRGKYLHLLVTSSYCALGLFYSWTQMLKSFFTLELCIDVWYNQTFHWGKEQRKLKDRLITENTERWERDVRESKFSRALNKLKFVAGFDLQSIDGDEELAVASLVVLSYPDLEVVWSKCKPVILTTPYYPGFLAFREAPAMEALFEDLKRTNPNLLPQALFIDGNGVLHPKGFGLACHIGVMLNIPTVGSAKNLHHVEGLIKDKDRYKKELTNPGQHVALRNHDGQTIGAALKSVADAENPIFVSIGHRIDLPTALSLTTTCSRYRVPEPTRQADQLCRREVRKLQDAYWPVQIDTKQE